VEVSLAAVNAIAQARIVTEAQVAVLKKSRDVQQAQAQALIELVKQAAPTPPHVGTLVNVVA
jgi:hypothetical protein